MTSDEKLRKALDVVLSALLGWQTGRTTRSEHAAAVKAARAALALPPRNCDLAEVAENPESAWLDDGDNWDEWGSPRLCIEKWLLAPAKAGAGERKEKQMKRVTMGGSSTGQGPGGQLPSGGCRAGEKEPKR